MNLLTLNDPTHNEAVNDHVPPADISADSLPISLYTSLHIDLLRNSLQPTRIQHNLHTYICDDSAQFMFPRDIIDLILFTLAKLEVTSSIRCARICRRSYLLLSIYSRDTNLGRVGRVCRFHMRNTYMIESYQINSLPCIPGDFLLFICTLPKTISGSPFIHFIYRYGSDVRWSKRIANVPDEEWIKLSFQYPLMELSQNKHIPPEFWQSHLYLIIWSVFCFHAKMPIEFWEQHINNIQWERLCENRHVPIQFLYVHKDKIAWLILSANSSIPEEFIEANLSQCDMSSLCSHGNFSVKFWTDNYDKIIWWRLSTNENAPVEFLLSNIDKIYWKTFSCKPKMPKWFWVKYHTKCRINNFLRYAHIDNAFWVEYINRIDLPYNDNSPSVSEGYLATYGFLEVLCQNESLSDEFWEPYIDHIKPLWLLHNRSISVDFWERYWDRLEYIDKARIGENSMTKWIHSQIK